MLLDESGEQVEMVEGAHKSSKGEEYRRLESRTVHFDSSDVKPVQGNPLEQLDYWEKRLGFEINDLSGQISPVRAGETSSRATSP